MLVYEDDLRDIPLSIEPGDIIFLHGDLGAGKTTLVRALLRKYGLPESVVVRSPTYTYVQEYILPFWGWMHWYHFDLYRIEEYDTFIQIGWEEMFCDESAVKIVEWSEKLANTYIPTKEVFIRSTENVLVREIEIRNAHQKRLS